MIYHLVILLLNTWYYIAFSYDKTTDTAYLVLNDKIVYSSGCLLVHGLREQPACSVYMNTLMYCIVQEDTNIEFTWTNLIFYRNKFPPPEYLAQHYTHNVPWVTTYSKLDLLMRPGVDGRLFTEYAIKSTLGIEAPYAEFNFEENANTGGGNATSGAWRKLTDSAGSLTQKTNTIAGLSVSSGGFSSGIFTLPAGTYDILYWHCFWETNVTNLRLRDLTNSVTLIFGGNGTSTADASFICQARGTIVITSQITCELEYYCATTKNANGLGWQCNHTEKELYGQIIFRKIA